MKVSRYVAAQVLSFALLCASASVVQAGVNNNANPAPDLDLRISYYSKVITAEGVTREARYQDKMLRRQSHVWLERIVANKSAAHHEHKPEQNLEIKKISNPKTAQSLTEHKHFNPVLIPRHIQLVAGKPEIEFIDAQEKMRVSVPASEYSNVNFDGSWSNAYYLLDPSLLKEMKLSATKSNEADAVWYEREKNGIFQKVLWHAKKQIPLIVESGDKAGQFYQRVEVQIADKTQAQLPWTNLKGYIQKEYADFLD